MDFLLTDFFQSAIDSPKWSRGVFQTELIMARSSAVPGTQLKAGDSSE